jgi:hypothetical protein
MRELDNQIENLRNKIVRLTLANIYREVSAKERRKCRKVARLETRK